MVGPGPGGGAPLENANPLIYRRSGERPVTAREEDDELPDSIDDREIFDILPGAGTGLGRGRAARGRAGRCGSAFLSPETHLIRAINDPEHPLTLEELNVVEQVRVKVRPVPPAGAGSGSCPPCRRATLPFSLTYFIRAVYRR